MQDEKGITHLTLRFTFLSRELHSAPAARRWAAAAAAAGGGRLCNKTKQNAVQCSKKATRNCEGLGVDKTYTVIDRE